MNVHPSDFKILCRIGEISSFKLLVPLSKPATNQDYCNIFRFNNFIPTVQHRWDILHPHMVDLIDLGL